MVSVIGQHRLLLDGAICLADSFEFSICHGMRLKTFGHE